MISWSRDRDDFHASLIKSYNDGHFQCYNLTFYLLLLW